MIYLTISLVASLGLCAFIGHRLVRLTDVERQRASEERFALLLRIQAPETAVALQTAQENDFDVPRLHLAFDADDEFAEYTKDRNLND